jgi:hypothetical protein
MRIFVPFFIPCNFLSNKPAVHSVLPYVENNTLEGMRFKNYLYRQAWYQANLVMSRVNLNMHWREFSKKIALRRLSPRP